MNQIQKIQARIDASRQARPTVPAPAYAACRAAALRAQIAHEELVASAPTMRPPAVDLSDEVELEGWL